MYTIKKHQAFTDDNSIRFYINKIETRITSEVKKSHYLQLFTFETMKLLGSTKNKITKNENDENVLCLEITEVVLVHCNIVNKIMIAIL